MATPSNTPHPPTGWFVYVDGQVYGPFDPPTLKSFFSEGRLTAQSLICPEVTGPFRPAQQWHDYPDWIKTAPSPNQPVPSRPQAATQTGQTTSRTSHILLIMAEIRSSQGLLFLQTLQSLGAVERVSHTNWLVKTTLSHNHAKAIIQPALTDQDRLMIIDISHNPIETLNLGQSMEDRIKGLFQNPL